jgi:FxsC-like protein
MARDFFFSYTRSDNSPYLKRFFKDLSTEVCMLRGLPPTAEVGFFDQQDLELGEDWDRGLVEALQSARTMVAIASPSYWKSEYCGREWALFQARLALATPRGEKPPPLLKPVMWYPFRIDGLPTAVTRGQLKFGDPQAVHNQQGLRYMLKQPREQKSAYNKLVDALAKEIVEAADAHQVPSLRPLPRLAEVEPAFPAKAASVAGVGVAVLPPVTHIGPKHVTFIYVAAAPQSFGAARTADPYIESGGPDWKPFYPVDKTRVHLFLQRVAAGDDLAFTSEMMPFGPSLISRIDEAWDKRQIVVVVVDPWTVHWDAHRATPEYQAVLQRLDKRLDYHWCVLVPWNESDLEAMAERDRITNTVRNTFDRHANLAPNPMFYRDGIRSADELKRVLGDVLTRLKEEIKKRAPVTMPIPVGPSKSVVTGTST